MENSNHIINNSFNLLSRSFPTRNTTEITSENSELKREFKFIIWSIQTSVCGVFAVAILILKFT